MIKDEPHFNPSVQEFKPQKTDSILDPSSREFSPSKYIMLKALKESNSGLDPTIAEFVPSSKLTQSETSKENLQHVQNGNHWSTVYDTPVQSLDATTQTDLSTSEQISQTKIGGCDLNNICSNCRQKLDLYTNEHSSKGYLNLRSKVISF